jgi:hypothetical protein
MGAQSATALARIVTEGTKYLDGRSPPISSEGLRNRQNNFSSKREIDASSRGLYNDFEEFSKEV